MSQIPAYSFSVEKGDKKNKILKAKSVNSPAGFPVFSITSSSMSKPHMTITPANNLHHIVATVSLHSLSSKIDITIHGRPLQLYRGDHFSTGHSFHHPTAGELKWKESGFLGTGLTLVDASGRELCRYKKRKGFDVLVQVDHAFMDMILVTGLAMAKYKKLENESGEAAGEVVSAIVGV